MTTQIYCVNPHYGVLEFYLLHKGRSYYLFQQPYRKRVYIFYRKGRLLNQALSYAKAKGNIQVQKTISKFPNSIRYIESEYGITVLERTRKQRLAAA